MKGKGEREGEKELIQDKMKGKGEENEGEEELL